MDNAKTRANELYYRAQENAPLNQRQALGLVTILVALGTITFIAGLTLTGTTLGFLFASPLLIIFSPILIPLAIFAFVAISSLLSFGGFASFVVWVYKYYKGAHPVGSDQVDAARYRIAEGAKEVRDKTYAVAEDVQEFVSQKTDTSVAA
ncbi:oleosin G [Physcomitrium patens]|uniref:Oleosin n=1 Tax=Physcomitrium patens TaxID=3218 RepID=A0A2K1LA25_PHYPA|nr:oleosin Bn-III-like [Physcomitrium patens]PNR62882.1 hypothetical protein PHYPA_001306 [Physcomitrium patens]|eukprot:XP_024371133.1 oleosin Bn-III-like [Physcomitrella patens]